WESGFRVPRRLDPRLRGDDEMRINQTFLKSVPVGSGFRGQGSGEQLFEIGDGLLEAFFQLYLGLPAGGLPRQGDVGLALDGVVAGEGTADQLGAGAGEVDDLFRQLADGEFHRVAQVDGAGDVVAGVHEPDEGFDQVALVAEGSGLAAVAEKGDGL